MQDYITEDHLIFFIGTELTIERINIDDKQMFSGTVSMPKGASGMPHMSQATSHNIVDLFKQLAQRAQMLSTLNVD